MLSNAENHAKQCSENFLIAQERLETARLKATEAADTLHKLRLEKVRLVEEDKRNSEANGVLDNALGAFPAPTCATEEQRMEWQQVLQDAQVAFKMQLEELAKKFAQTSAPMEGVKQQEEVVTERKPGDPPPPQVPPAADDANVQADGATPNGADPAGGQAEQA